ncbi:MAG: adenosylcobinamide-GDP ribazoletransferase [Thalassospira sp.]|nr:adenosylcobinamide-GDP ribazoletransferase [Thalassospira sp.]MBO6818005.1 adenosylcobinamide-GDP ribazoletransferase [Thalassospira sp.]MBO6886640.1 adenosylcobinamide-GDP ribazoletransferase [Thalassospira sp.]
MLSKDHNQNETNMQSSDSSDKPSPDTATDASVEVSRISDFWRALALLSRVPVKGIDDFRAEVIARSVWSWPLVGLLLAGFAMLPAMLVYSLTANILIFAIIASAGMVLLTGSMHEDGIADCADGFGGGFERARKLEIMRDSQIGTYGVVALILCFGLRLILLSAAGDAGQAAILFLVMAITSRAAMPVVMHILPPARDDGLGKGAGTPSVMMVGLGVGLALILSLVLSGLFATLAIFMGGLLAVGIVAAVAKWQIGGQTGDVLGATQIVTELFVGIAFIAVL